MSQRRGPRRAPGSVEMLDQVFTHILKWLGEFSQVVKRHKKGNYPIQTLGRTSREGGYARKQPPIQLEQDLRNGGNIERMECKQVKRRALIAGVRFAPVAEKIVMHIAPHCVSHINGNRGGISLSALSARGPHLPAAISIRAHAVASLRAS